MKLESKLMWGDLFDSLGKEGEQKEKRFDLKKDPQLEEICRKFERYLNRIKPTWVGDGYIESIEEIRTPYSCRDITLFSLKLSSYDDHRDFKWFGAFISGLINLSYDSMFKLITKDLNLKLDLAGLNNTKKIFIYGDVGEDAGYSMVQGKIQINGDAGDGLGCSLRDGSIIVSGNAGDFAGYKMIGGIVEIAGDAGEDVGHEMRGGIILLKGSYKSMSLCTRGGNIYHKGKLLVKNGRRIG